LTYWDDTAIEITPDPFLSIEYSGHPLCWLGSGNGYLVNQRFDPFASEDMRLGFWIAPQMFHALGLGLLVPNLSPGISEAFGIPTAAVDFFTAILALLAFVDLFRGCS